MNINEKLFKLENDDSFYKASAKVKEYKEKHPDAELISLGIGDVHFPICKHIADKMKEAVDREASNEYVGYGNYWGTPELIKAIQQNEYPQFSYDEIYVSDGTKSDVGNILELFNPHSKIGVFNPTYPIYINSVLSSGRNYEIIDCDENFDLVVPDKHFDVLYICSPSNPTGINHSKETLEKIVKYAINENCIIIYDNVYFKFIENGVKSIYEIEGANKCAIEMRSFSKHASFTGIRCSYYVVPKEIAHDINKYWKFRTINRFNGASYIAQVGALASFDKEAKEWIDKNIEYYKENASILRNCFTKCGYKIVGGTDAPYIWIKTKNGLSGWEICEKFLNEIQVILVPGAIFGSRGNDYFRVSSLGKREDILKAISRIESYEQKNK